MKTKIPLEDDKDRIKPDAPLQVILKGGKEVFTIRKVPEDDAVNRNKPDIKTGAEAKPKGDKTTAGGVAKSNNKKAETDDNRVSTSTKTNIPKAKHVNRDKVSLISVQQS